jgi:DNA-binding response OmpR family regulator
MAAEETGLMATTFHRDHHPHGPQDLRDPRPQRPRHPAGRRPTVLIVEDEPHLSLLYELELRRAGFATLTAGDGRACLDNLLSMDIDLVILDLRMPGMDGIDLLARIRGLDRSLPVVINTAYSDYANNYLTWSADDFVVKSSDVSDLVARVRQLVGHPAD